MLDNINTGIFMVDADGTVSLINHRVRSWLHTDTERFIGRPYAELLDAMPVEQINSEPFMQVDDLIADIQLNQSYITRRSYALTVPEYRAIDEVSIPVASGEEPVSGRIFVLQDTTERLRVDQYRDEMSHMLVHDLRGPTAGLIASLHLAIDEMQSDASVRDEQILHSTLQVALMSANKLLDLVESILKINKLEAGEVTLELKPFSLATVALRVSATLSHIAEAESLSIALDVPDALPAIVADEELIERVVTNLVDNALRFSPDGGEVTIKVVARSDDQVIVVSDQGRGIEPEERDRIFERFYQINGSDRPRGGKGSGLGLTFCKLAVEAHGGRIWVEESANGGAAFHVVLPNSSAQSQ
ncbi:MAG: ATP-binding protein [Anaerolineae bacterium]